MFWHYLLSLQDCYYHKMNTRDIKFDNIFLNTSFIPPNCSAVETYDYSKNESTEILKIWDICRTGPYEDKYGNINKFAQEKRDIIIESDIDIELKLGGQKFYCKKGKHFFSKFLFRWHSFDIPEGQKYKLYVINNDSEEREYFFRMMTELFDGQIVYIDDLHSTLDDERYVVYMAGCFGGIPTKCRSAKINFDDVINKNKMFGFSKTEILNPDKETLTYTLKIQHENLYDILEDDDIVDLIKQSPWEYLTKVPSTRIRVKETNFDKLQRILSDKYSLQITKPHPDPQFRDKTQEEINNDNRFLIDKASKQIDSINKYIDVGYLLVNVLPDNITSETFNEVKNEWLILAKKILLSDDNADNIWSTICCKYTETHRYYHTLVHIQDMLRKKNQIKSKIKDEETFVLAIFFHDIFYHPENTTNEEDSVRYLDVFENIDYHKANIQKVSDYIMQTKQHNVINSNDEDLKLFIDIDMSILGSDSNTYDWYTKQIRSEYSHINDADYSKGRSDFLRNTKGRIFASDYFYDILEAKAKENISRELEYLSSQN